MTVILALLLDKLFAEPKRFHPLVGFGRLANWLEQKVYANSRIGGVVALALLLVPIVLLAMLLQMIPGSYILGVVVLYIAIGWQSLEVHARSVYDALMRQDLSEAREQVSRLVSRDTSTLDEQGVAKAAIESVLENGNDAIFAAIFWYLLAGIPGVVLYRLANTLDAMWGYRNQRYQHFGWAAARLDDVLNYIPARLTALSYAAVGRYVEAIACWRAQTATWKSPNAGVVMAAGAGSLGVELGGAERYHGQLESRGPLGKGRAPDAEAIEQSLQLIRRAIVVWVIFALVWGGFSA